MNRKVAALTLAGLLSTSFAFASSAVPPTAIPGVNQGGTESREDKTDKKGEEASGSNSGAESHETDKDSAGSSGSKQTVKEPKQ